MLATVIRTSAGRVMAFGGAGRQLPEFQGGLPRGEDAAAAPCHGGHRVSALVRPGGGPGDRPGGGVVNVTRA